MDSKTIIKAIIAGIIWWFTYLYIRRYFNPENNYNIEKYKLDGFYGGIAAGVAVIINYYVNKYIL
jgi:hypothetical protein